VLSGFRSIAMLSGKATRSARAIPSSVSVVTMFIGSVVIITCSGPGSDAGAGAGGGGAATNDARKSIAVFKSDDWSWCCCSCWC